METTRSRIPRLLLAVAVAATTPGLLLAQDHGAGPGRTIVAQFSIPDDAFEGVSSSVELVQALRDYLTIDVAMPLEEPLRVAFRGVAGAQNAEGPPYIFDLHSIGVDYAGQEPLANFPYAVAVRESYGDDRSDDREDAESGGAAVGGPGCGGACGAYESERGYPSNGSTICEHS